MTSLILRKGIWKDKDVGDLARDVEEAMNRRTSTGPTTIELDALYTEPLYVPAPSEPNGLFAVRIRKTTDLQTPLLTGGLCHFVFESNKQRCRVLSIDGMTPGTGFIYRYTFLMV